MVLVSKEKGCLDFGSLEALNLDLIQKYPWRVVNDFFMGEGDFSFV